MNTLQKQTVDIKLQDSVEELAQQFVMAELSDLSVFESMAETLAGISAQLESNFPRCSASAAAAADLLQKLAWNKKNPTEFDLHSVEKTISCLQSLTQTGHEDGKFEFPESFAIPDAHETGSEAGKNGGKKSYSAVDREILEEYFARQEAVASEMEDLILAYEKHPDPQILKELKRLLHTAKGEAGVIGLYRIENVFHHVEDYLQEKEAGLDANLLLEFKDWFEQTIAAIKNNGKPPAENHPIGAIPGAKGDGVAKATVPRFDDDPEDTRAEKSEYLYLLNPVDIEDPEITADFISETVEHFEISDENLLILERDPENEDAIATIFRAFHTIKGTTSFIGLPPISELAHKAENLLDEVRKKRLNFEGKVVDATFNAFDLIKKMIRQLETALVEGKPFEPDPELPSILAQLKKAISGNSVLPFPKALKTRCFQKETSEDVENVSEIDIVERKTGENERKLEGNVSGYATKPRKAVKQTMKIDAERIDLLLETIGELVIVESIVSREASMRKEESCDMERNMGQLAKITRSLQDIGMSMRLIPIDATFGKMGRLVRDLARKTGKKIELVMVGKETELDKSMVEKLGDPLVHMVRNAVDHGIESSPEERIAAGKDPVAKILLKAYHKGGNIHIEIRDDGRGLDKEAIAANAIRRGLISGTEKMTDEEIFALIFEPGFSTSSEITEVSGRGVGMDVVKNNIESVRGNVRIASEPGKGTLFTLVLPLTTAIIDGMVVRVGAERYILPLLSIIESFQPSQGMIFTVAGKGETIPFRNRLLPLFRLADLYLIPGAERDPAKALVVVVEDSGRKIALLVDELLGQNQTVIKKLGEGIGDVEGISGANIMPDGMPGLIIDVNGLIKLATAS